MIVNIQRAARRNGGAVVATLPVRRGDDVMLVTDAGRLIRVPADQVRITARQTMGVTLFRMAEGERVTSVFPVIEAPGDAAAEGSEGAEAAGAPLPSTIPPGEGVADTADSRGPDGVTDDTDGADDTDDAGSGGGDA